VPRTIFAGTGFYVPDRVVTNEELTRYMDTSDAWIVERTGIRERRWVPEGMSGADMARRAAEMALEEAGMEPSQVDAVRRGREAIGRGLLALGFDRVTLDRRGYRRGSQLERDPADVETLTERD